MASDAINLPVAAAGNPAQRVINPWIIAVAVMLSTFMEVLDTTVVNVSLPHIAGNLSASVDEATWALTSYLVANAIILADHRMAGQLFRTQTPAARFRHRIYHRVASCAAWLLRCGF